jgi:hypothetical protein
VNNIPQIAPDRFVSRVFFFKKTQNALNWRTWANGVNWVQQPDGAGANATPNPVRIPMTADVLVGLFVTSHAVGEIRTYTFDNVSMGLPLTAQEPEPEDGAVHPGTWAQLSWGPGTTATSHDVYFGENFTDVSSGAGDTFRGNQRLTSFPVGVPGSPYPDGLAPGTTYYWRVDEVEADGVTRHRGDVWSFLVPSGQPDASAVSTFHCIGVYWSPQDGSSDNVCQVRYRSDGSTAWKEGLPLWYDD